VYKGYSARQLNGDFPEKGWKLRSLNYLLKKLRTVRAPPSSSFVVRRRISSLPTCGLPTAQILIPWITESGQCYRSGSINSLCKMLMSWSDASLTVGQASSRRSLIKQLISGELGWGHAFEPEADILNICCNVFVLQCLLTVIFQFCYGLFRLNVRDNNDDVPAYVT